MEKKNEEEERSRKTPLPASLSQALEQRFFKLSVSTMYSGQLAPDRFFAEVRPQTHVSKRKVRKKGLLHGGHVLRSHMALRASGISAFSHVCTVYCRKCAIISVCPARDGRIDGRPSWPYVTLYAVWGHLTFVSLTLSRRNVPGDDDISLET